MSLGLCLYNMVKYNTPLANCSNDIKDNNVFAAVEKVFLESGATFDTAPERRNVLAIRKFTPVTKDNPRGLFDDVIIIAWSTDKGATLTWDLFDANTDPSYQYTLEGTPTYRPKAKDQEGQGADADGDGKNDLGMLPPGVYKFKAYTETHKVLGNVFKPLKAVRVYRDINRDGYFTKEDEDLIKYPDRMSDLGTMYIHRAYRKGTTLHSWSAGCQTMMFEDFERFRTNMAKGKASGQTEFTYVLIEI